MCEAQSTRSFEYVDEESIDIELKCSICTEPFIDPVITIFCKHIFCRSGIERVLTNKSACPLCRHEPIQLSELQPVDVAIRNILDQVLVSCQFCNETNIQRGLFDDHIRSRCPKVKIPCSAADLKCPWMGLRDQQASHISQCGFESMRSILSQYIIMEKQFEQVQRDKQVLQFQVNGYEHRCEQLERQIGRSFPIPLRSGAFPINATWSRNGSIIAGGNGYGVELNQLKHPQGFYLDDDDQTVYIADSLNHRIVEWKLGATVGKIVAGGNGLGNQSNQLHGPTDVIVDKEQNCLLICDRDNRRIVRWSLRDAKNGETITNDIGCNCLTMDDNKNLYITDIERHAVIRWKQGETQGTVIAGGNGQGNRLDQLSYPTFIFIDRDHSVYVSDYYNHRVMKWTENAREGIIVAGGQGNGDSLAQFKCPGGVTVDQWGTVYVGDSENHRITCWPKGASEGRIAAGGNGRGVQLNQTHRPSSISFDRHGNLYVSEYNNDRIQKFDINTSIADADE